MIDLKKGDIFLTRNPMMLGKIINAVQKFNSPDNESIYSHAGIIIDESGKTLEALWTVKSQNIYKDYKGIEVLILRYSGMTDEAFSNGMKKIKRHVGDFYPVIRLFTMIIPQIAKHLYLGNGVCSELTGEFLNGVGLKDVYWKGWTPDNLHDYTRIHRDFSVVHKGVPI